MLAYPGTDRNVARASACGFSFSNRIEKSAKAPVSEKSMSQNLANFHQSIPIGIINSKTMTEAAQTISMGRTFFDPKQLTTNASVEKPNNPPMRYPEENGYQPM
jgi:hypothetical protein